MKPSWTAQGAAAQRALLTDRGVLDDPYARGMLTRGMAATSWALGRVPGLSGRSVTLAGAAGSDLWFDAALTSALDGGITQVAVIGAGYDSRAWRMQRDGVRFFEVDHAASQQQKTRVAPGPGPTYVQADLRVDSAAGALAAHGLDTSQPVFFVLQSVTMYLTDEIVRRQLAQLADSAASGSLLAVNFLPALPPRPRPTGSSASSGWCAAGAVRASPSASTRTAQWHWWRPPGGPYVSGPASGMRPARWCRPPLGFQWRRSTSASRWCSPPSGRAGDATAGGGQRRQPLEAHRLPAHLTGRR